MIGPLAGPAPARCAHFGLLAMAVLLALPAPALRDRPATPPVRPCAADPSPSADSQRWRHPVDAPIVDGFRPPSDPYGPGNRGLEYGTAPGARVTAVAGGTVTFAGSVGRSKFVVVQHPDGIRSTYGYLLDIDTEPGRPVVAGQPIASARAGFHLTARRGGTYLDPLLFLAAECFVVRLVPIPPGTIE